MRGNSPNLSQPNPGSPPEGSPCIQFIPVLVEGGGVVEGAPELVRHPLQLAQASEIPAAEPLEVCRVKIIHAVHKLAQDGVRVLESLEAGILFLKHASIIFRQSSNPVMWFLHDGRWNRLGSMLFGLALPCTGLEDCLNMLVS